MFFWKHNNDLSAPPELEDLVRRRPDGRYWESNASTRREALETFWVKWKRKTGKEYPHAMPQVQKRSDKIGFAGSRSPATRRPAHYDEKTKQDANG